MKTRIIPLLALIVLTAVWWLLSNYYFGPPGGFLHFLLVYLFPLVLFLALLLFSLLAKAVGGLASKMDARLWLIVGLLILIGLALPDTTLVMLLAGFFSDSSTAAPPSAYMWGTHWLIILALVASALLLYVALNRSMANMSEPVAADGRSAPERQRLDRTAVALFGLSALLPVKALHNLYWLTVWDNTYDPLTYLWLFFPILTLLLAAVLLAAALPGRAKLSGLYYMPLLALLVIAVSYQAQQVDFRQLTNQRAQQVVQAVERYYEREGRYPATLAQVTAWPRRTLPGPVILYGQEWCYDGGPDYYRLGYIDREHWSAPHRIPQLYNAVGDLPDLDPLCGVRVVYQYSHEAEGEQ
jgi:hypothetical protein